MNVVELLQAQAGQRPNAAAVVETRRDGPITSFGELDARAARAAALLHRSGVRSGDGVLIVHPMSTELYIALAAVFRLGAIAMFIDPSADPRIINDCCALRPPAAYLSSPLGQLLRLRFTALRKITLNFSTARAVPGAIAWDRARNLAPFEDVFVAGPDTPALMTFTSGSTGMPKAAVRTHSVLRAQLAALQETMRLAPGSVDITTLPIVLLANLACGVTSVICDVDLRRPGRVEGSRVFADARERRATSATASPAFFERLASYCSHDSLVLPDMQKIFCGGAPVFPKVLDELKALAPESDPCAVYGSTEAEPIAHLSRSRISTLDREAMREGAGLLAGTAVPAVRLRIIRDQWGTPIPSLNRDEFAGKCLPAREPGEIVVAGKHVLPGYLGGRGDEETKFKVENEIWHRTGDLGYLDERERLWLLGRCGASIADAKGTLYPFTVETAASHVAGVRRCAALAVNGRRLLAIEAEKDHAGEVTRDLRSTLGWAHIDEFRFLRRIPVDRRHNAKIDYPALRRLLM